MEASKVLIKRQTLFYLLVVLSVIVLVCSSTKVRPNKLACMDATYIAALLKHGYGLHNDRQLIVSLDVLLLYLLSIPIAQLCQLFHSFVCLFMKHSFHFFNFVFAKLHEYINMKLYICNM